MPRVTVQRVERLALALVVVVGIASGGMLSRWPVEAMRSWRGKPWQGAAIGMLLARSSRPAATVAAAGGGALGYFSHRTVIDLDRQDRPVDRPVAGPRRGRCPRAEVRRGGGACNAGPTSS